MGLVIGGLSENISALFLYKVNGVNYFLIYGYGLRGHTLRCMRVGVWWRCRCRILFVSCSSEDVSLVPRPHPRGERVWFHKPDFLG